MLLRQSQHSTARQMTKTEIQKMCDEQWDGTDIEPGPPIRNTEQSAKPELDEAYIRSYSEGDRYP